ncbi:MAG: hypothetical protein R6V53_00090 [Candidatus Woesearchaeota archaeon]
MGPALYGSGGMASGPMGETSGPTGTPLGKESSTSPEQMYANPFDALIKGDYQKSPRQQYETKSSSKYKR